MEARARDLLLGIDVGTTSIKAAAFTPDGVPVAAASRACEPIQSGRDRWELELDSCWTGIRGCCADLLAGGLAPQEVAALAVSAQAETVAPLDARGEALRPAIMWLDGRSAREARELAEELGEERLHEVSGQPRVLPMWPATKILWIARHEPRVHAAARWWAQPLDYICFRLTGRMVSEASVYSSSLMLDIGSRTWWTPMLDRVGVAPDQLPELVDGGTVLGGLRAGVADELGLASGTPVVMGGFDQACTALGAGNAVPGAVSESTGTSLALHSTVEGSSVPQLGGAVPLHLHVVRGHSFLNASAPTAGAALDWFRKALATDGGSYERFAALAGSVAPGSDGVVVLPHLAGSVSPELDPAARGVVFGLSTHHTAAHVARAALEGVGFALAEMLDAERALGANPDAINAVGGGSQLDLWLQIKADILGVPVLANEVRDAGALGAAILAGVGAGVFESEAAGCDRMVRVRARFEPDPAHAARYAEARATYRELYPRLRTLFARLDAAEAAPPTATQEAM